MLPNARPVRFAFDPRQFPDFSWRGYAVMSPAQVSSPAERLRLLTSHKLLCPSLFSTGGSSQLHSFTEGSSATSSSSPFCFLLACRAHASLCTQPARRRGAADAGFFLEPNLSLFSRRWSCRSPSPHPALSTLSCVTRPPDGRGRHACGRGS